MQIRFEGEDEEKEEKNNFNKDYKYKNTPTFDNLKYYILRYVNKQIPKDAII